MYNTCLILKQNDPEQENNMVWNRFAAILVTILSSNYDFTFPLLPSGGDDKGSAVTEKMSTCDMPKDPGPCRGYMVRWYWDREQQRCDRFVYGGCQGNTNNFMTLEECEAEMCDMKDGETTPGFSVTTQGMCGKLF